MAELNKWTTAQVISQLDSGHKWSGNALVYTFPTSSSFLYGTAELSGFSPFNLQQQSAASLALKLWNDLISLTISYTSGTADIEFGNSTVGVDYAHAYQPSVGSVWMSSNYPALMTPVIDEYSFMTFEHEIGHSLGLDHAGTYNGTGTWKPSNYYDSTVYTVMSYFGPSMSSGSGLVAWADWVGSDGKLYSPQTPMLYDIMAIQSMYGADTTTRTDNTTYGFNSTISDDSASIYDFSSNTHPILTIYDANGIDTLNLSGWSSNSTINLAPGTFSSANDMTNNISIAYTAVIENAVGGSGNDTLIGNNGANTLDGGAGADMMSGGNGNDTYVIDNISDKITETATGGIDTATTYIDYTLAAYVENLTLLGTSTLKGTGNLLNNILVGNGVSNLLTGGGGNDRLNGGVGADTMLGGAGNDSYVVDDVGDIVSEATVLNGSTNAGGSDTVESGISTYTLGLYVENLIFIGVGSAVGYGNTLNNGMSGTDGADSLSGLSGNDTLQGGSGNDTLDGGVGSDILDGGSGIDTLIGGIGNDTYIVDRAEDQLVESSTLSSEIDTVQSYVSWTLGDNLEKLTLLGSANLNGTGNGLNNTLTGNSGNNILDGGAGGDTMIGGSGDDTYRVDNSGDRITETGTGGYDRVNSSVNYTLSSYVEELTLLGSDNINGTGSAQNNTLIGNSGNNILDGGLGSDTLTGSIGSDIFYFANALSAANIDKITDFTVGEDIIGLSHTIFSKIGSTLDTIEFISGDGYSKGLEADNRIVYNTFTGALYYDSDGSGKIVPVQFATLLGAPSTLSYSDFIIV